MSTKKLMHNLGQKKKEEKYHHQRHARLLPISTTAHADMILDLVSHQTTTEMDLMMTPTPTLHGGQEDPSLSCLSLLSEEETTTASIRLLDKDHDKNWT